jgi:hypothetical protein
MIRLNVTCGCGFRSDDLQQADAHATATGHVLSIAGEVRTSEAPLIKSVNHARASLLQRRLNDALWVEAFEDERVRPIAEAMRGGRL